MKESLGKMLKALNYKNLLPYVVLAVLLALSVLIWQFYESSTLRREERRYNEYVEAVVNDITKRLDKHKMILRGGAGLFPASEEVTRAEWRAYYEYQQVSTLYPGIQRVTFSRVVRPWDLAQHIEEIRAEGFPDYTVWPAGESELYAPLIYLEPFDEGARGALGFDLFSEPVRQGALEQARDTGEAVLSQMVVLVSEEIQGSRPGFLIVVPVYDKGDPMPDTVEKRRAGIYGYIIGAYTMTALMEGIFPESSNTIAFAIYDGAEVSPATLMYGSRVFPGTIDEEHQPLFTSQKTVDLYGHQWTMAFETTSAFEAVVDRHTHWAILGAGLLVSILIFLYLKSITTTGDRAHTLAQKMTNELRESEAKYRFLTENIMDIVWTVDLEGNLTYISPAIEKLIGFTPEKAMSMSMDEYTVRKDYDALMARLAEELAKPPAERARSATMEVRYKTKDNRLVPAELSASWIIDEQGNYIGVQGTTRDITERKKLEEQIAKSRKMYQSVVDTQQEIICRYMPDTSLTFVNDAYCKYYGKNRQEILGHRFLEFTPPELHDEILEVLNSLTPDKPSARHEHYVLLPDGSIRWQEWTEQAIFTKTDEIKEFQGVGRDITERVQAEGDLLQAYDATIEGWAHALDLKDEETEDHSQRVTDMTVEIARKLGVKDEELAHVRRGALLHDIGKMGIPDSILLKPGPLTDEEWVVMRQHPVHAFNMLAAIDYLRPALDIPYCHHEKWDGMGYPRGLKGEEIPLPARIFAVVDVYDALTSDRPYRKAWSREETLEHIKKESGKHFDPQVVEVFFKEIGNKI